MWTFFSKVKIFFIFISFSLPLFSQSVSENHSSIYILQDQKDFSDFGKNILYLSDPLFLQNFETIQNPTIRAGFHTLSSVRPNFGYSNHPYWVKFELQNHSGEENYILEYNSPSIDFIDLKIVYRDHTEFFQTGDQLPFSQRPVVHRNFIFPIKIAKGEKVQFFMKVYSGGNTEINLNLWDSKTFHDNDYLSQWMYGCFFGIFIGILLFILFLFFSTEEVMYIYYFALVFALSLYILKGTGFAFMFIWPNYPRINNLISPVLIHFVSFFGVKFISPFLNLEIYLPRVYRSLKYYSFFLLGLIILSPFMEFAWASKISNLGILITLVINLTMAIYLIKRNRVPALIFLVCFIGFLFSGISTILLNIGILERNIYSTNATQWSTLFGVFVLSMGISYRLNVLKKERIHYELQSERNFKKLKRIQSEIETAGRIHRSILPSYIPRISGVDLFAYYSPSSQIGGDFYDFCKISEHEIGILLVDVTGHGLPASLFASMVKLSFTNAISYQKKPAELLESMNKALSAKLGNYLLTAGYLYINTLEKNCLYSSCGHPPVLYMEKNSGKLNLLKPRGRMIGIDPEIYIESLRVEYDTDIRILFYTDGLTECVNSKEEFYGEIRLNQMIRELKNEKPKDFSAKLIRDLTDFSQTGSQFQDDITFLIIDLLAE